MNLCTNSCATGMYSEPHSEYETIEQLKAKLPQYVVNCFLSARYHTMEMIADIDDNCLEEIETFIQESFPNDPIYSHIPSASCCFPPGHRKRIKRFIEEVNLSLKESRKQSPKPSSKCSTG